jgi:hypothetical protein
MFILEFSAVWKVTYLCKLHKPTEAQVIYLIEKGLVSDAEW